MGWFFLGIVLGVICTLLAIRYGIQQITGQIKKAHYYNAQTHIRSVGYSKSLSVLVDDVNKLIREYHEAAALNESMILQNRQITTSIAHDFRTPLTSMLGYVQLVLENTSNPKDIQRLQLIEGRIKVLNRHVEDFYTLSLISSSEYPIKCIPCNPNRLVQEHIALYYDTLSEHFDKIQIDIDDSSDCVAYVDPQAFIRILENITRNASIHGSGYFTISVSILNSRYHMKISNSGAPSSLDIDRIFERSYQGNTERSSQSSGLGLNIAHSLSKLQDINLFATLSDDVITFHLDFELIKS